MAKKKYVDPEAEHVETPDEHASEATSVDEPSPRVHIVRKGDTLRSIAREYLGDSRFAGRIRTMNHLATDILIVGRELIIPDR